MATEKNPGGGFLALVATPIGNLDDITLRALKILGEADLVAAEDTRKARFLLDKHNLSGKRVVSYHAYNERGKTEWLLDQVKNGSKVALVSDAGTPCLSDPGFLLAREAVRNGIEPLVVPGVSSLTFAVAAAALPVDTFCFYGFLPVKSGRRRKVLDEIAASNRTAFILESPKRVLRLLGEIVEAIGPDTAVALVREATKLYEETIRGNAAAVLESLRERSLKGEFVVAVCPRGKLGDSDPTYDTPGEGGDDDDV